LILLDACLLYYSPEDTFTAFNRKGAWAQIVFVSLFSADKSVRTSLVNAVHQIVVKVKMATPLPPTPPTDGTAPPPTPEIPTILGMTLPVLWRAMPSVADNSIGAR
jgi:hypothetical protein